MGAASSAEHLGIHLRARRTSGETCGTPLFLPVLPFTQIYFKTFRKKTQQHAGPVSTTTALEHRDGHTCYNEIYFSHLFCSPLPQTQSMASQLWWS